MTVVALHRDSASLEFHLAMGGAEFRKFADLIELLRIDVFGHVSEAAVELLHRRPRCSAKRLSPFTTSTLGLRGTANKSAEVRQVSSNPPTPDEFLLLGNQAEYKKIGPIGRLGQSGADHADHVSRTEACKHGRGDMGWKIRWSSFRPLRVFN